MRTNKFLTILLWLLIAAVIVLCWRTVLHNLAYLILLFVLLKFLLRLLLFFSPVLMIVLALYLLSL